MKRVLLVLVIALSMAACSVKGAKNDITDVESKADGVEVLYFYGKQRCATCNAIEQNAKELVATVFAEQVKEGRVAFKSVDITENEALADKYEVSWSSLIVVARENGKESFVNMTEFGFSKARTAPDVFKKGLEEQINKMLK